MFNVQYQIQNTLELDFVVAFTVKNTQTDRRKFGQKRQTFGLTGTRWAGSHNFHKTKGSLSWFSKFVNLFSHIENTRHKNFPCQVIKEDIQCRIRFDINK